MIAHIEMHFLKISTSGTKLLYKIPKIGLHLYLKYAKNHKDALEMRDTRTNHAYFIGVNIMS